MNRKWVERVRNLSDLYNVAAEKEREQARYFYEEIGFMNSNIVTQSYNRYFVLIKDLEFILINEEGQRYIIDINPEHICRVRRLGRTRYSSRGWEEATCVFNESRRVSVVGYVKSIEKIESRFDYINKLESYDVQEIASETTFSNTEIREKAIDFEARQASLRDEKENFITRINEREKELEHNDRFTKLLSNYAIQSDKSVFWSYTNVGMEYVIGAEYFTSQIEQIPEAIPLILEEVEDLSTLSFNECERCIRYSNYFEQHEKFIMLLKRNEYITDYFEGIYLFWKLYRRYCFDQIGTEFEKAHGNIFDGSLSLGLNELVQKFIQIPIINPRDSEAVFSFACYLMKKRFIDEDREIYDLKREITVKVYRNLEELELDQLERDLLGNKEEEKDSLTIEDIDMMTGLEFEEFVESLFKKMGYETKRTKKTGDQGIDLIAHNTNGMKFGIQAKCYSKSITNKAVQEVSAGLKFYNLNKGMVITNRYLTPAAMKLSDANNIIVWDRTILNEKLERYF